MTRLRVFVKVVGVVAATALAVSVPLVVRLVTLNSVLPVARIGSRASWLWSRALCAILRIRVRTHGEPRGEPFVVAANHVSYLDILVLGSLYPGQFVAKREIRGWPVFGWVSRAAGTLFVDRDNPRDAVRAVRQVEHLLAARIPVTLFPEGGTSPGLTIRPFQPMLLQPAASTGVPCFAASLSYETPGSADPPAGLICWHDGSNFVKHFKRLMALDRIEASVSFSRTAVRSRDRKELARKLWEDAHDSFIPLRHEPAAPRECAP